MRRKSLWRTRGIARRGMLAGLMTAAAMIATSVTAAPASAWTPEAASYNVGMLSNQAVTASDGTVLRADVYYPTDPKTGAEAAGPFPVILTQTPYGKDDAAIGGTAARARRLQPVPRPARLHPGDRRRPWHGRLAGDLRSV